MKLSVCIIYYNQEKYVKESIESVLGLNFKSGYEILAGDDGSEDNTIKILEEYEREHPDKIKVYKNAGISEEGIKNASNNRLNLADKAKGEYLLFLDGDDYYCDKDFIEKACNFLDKNKEYICYAYNFKYLYKDREEVFKTKLKEGGISAEEYIENEYYTTSNAVIFRNILDKKKIELLRASNNFDDSGITIYFLQYGKMYYENKVIYAYRQREQSLWNELAEIERNIIYAMDYKLLSDTAKGLKRSILKRQFPSIKYLYKRKGKLQLPADRLEKYKKAAGDNGDKFILNLLQWNNLTLKERIKTQIYFNWLKVNRYC